MSLMGKMKELAMKYVFDLLASKQIRLAILAAVVGVLGKANVVLSPEQAEPVYMAILAALAGLAVKDFGKEKARVEAESWAQERISDSLESARKIAELKAQLEAKSKGKK